MLSSSVNHVVVPVSQLKAPSSVLSPRLFAYSLDAAVNRTPKRPFCL